MRMYHVIIKGEISIASVCCVQKSTVRSDASHEGSAAMILQT